MPTSLLGHSSGFDHLLPNMTTTLQLLNFGTRIHEKKQGVLRSIEFRQVPWKFTLGSMCCCNSDMHSFPQCYESAQFVLAWDSRRLSLLVSIAFCRNYCSYTVYFRQTVTEKLCLTQNKYTPLYDAAYHTKDSVGVKFSFPATF